MATPITFALSDLACTVRQYIIPLLNQHTIFTFTGPLGVGKTTLIKELLKQSGIHAVTTSPTFSYVNTYLDNQMRTLNHFDLYRIETIEQFISAGFDEILVQKNSLNFIEWPSVINELLSNPGLKSTTCSIILEYDQTHQENRLLRIIL